MPNFAKAGKLEGVNSLGTALDTPHIAPLLFCFPTNVSVYCCRCFFRVVYECLRFCLTLFREYCVPCALTPGAASKHLTKQQDSPGLTSHSSLLRSTSLSVRFRAVLSYERRKLGLQCVYTVEASCQIIQMPYARTCTLNPLRQALRCMSTNCCRRRFEFLAPTDWSAYIATPRSPAVVNIVRCPSKTKTNLTFQLQNSSQVRGG